MSLIPATITSRRSALNGVAVTSAAELDSQQLVAHSHVIAMLERSRGRDPYERSIRASQVLDLRAPAVPRHRRVSPRHERIVAKHQVTVFATEHELLAEHVANVAVSARGHELDQPAPWLARRRPE